MRRYKEGRSQGISPSLPWTVLVVLLQPLRGSSSFWKVPASSTIQAWAGWAGLWQNYHLLFSFHCRGGRGFLLSLTSGCLTIPLFSFSALLSPGKSTSFIKFLQSERHRVAFVFRGWTQTDRVTTTAIHQAGRSDSFMRDVFEFSRG